MVGVPEQTVTGRELALVSKTSGGAVPLSPPPKQDPKRSKIVMQNEKSNRVVLRRPLQFMCFKVGHDEGL